MKPKFKIGEWVYISQKIVAGEFESPGDKVKVQITNITLQDEGFIYFFNKNFIDRRAYYEYRLIKIQSVNYLPSWF